MALNNKNNLRIHKTTDGNVVFEDNTTGAVFAVYPQTTIVGTGRDLIGQNTYITLNEREQFTRLQVAATQFGANAPIPFNPNLQDDAALLAILQNFFVPPSTGGGGDATAANQVAGNETLTAINNKLPSSVASAANQTTTNNTLAQISGNIGSTTDAAATSDTGTFSLIAFFKRLLSAGIKLRDAATGALLNFGAQSAANSLPVVPSTTGQLLAFSRISTASTNAVLVKTGSTKLATMTISNTTNGLFAATRYIKIFNKATAPIAGTDIPVWREVVPANTTFVFSFPEGGLLTPLGLGITITSGIADTSNGAVNANDVVVNIAYK